MKILLISDSHGKHIHYSDKIDAIEDIDIIIHAGDVSSSGYVWEVENFLAWFSSLKAKHRVMIAGNHDFFFEDYPLLVKETLTTYPNIIYLQDSEIVIDGIKIYGSPQSPRFFDWAFNVDRGDKIREFWLKIPLDTDILVVHGLCQGILDFVERDQKHVGCEDLLDIVTTQVKPLVFAAGHIHGARGHEVKIIDDQEIHFFNASVLDERYKPAYDPYLIELDKKSRKVSLI